MENKKETGLYLENLWSDKYEAEMASAQGICNCLNNDCQGCFYQCPICKSTKCMYVEIRRNIDTLEKRGSTSKGTKLHSSEAEQQKGKGQNEKNRK